MTRLRPFRFGFTGGASSKPQKLLDPARAVEALGYSTYGLADHFVRPSAPLIAGQAVADATHDLRITETVLAQDFRHPAVLAKELAILDVLSQGRLQIGLGAGWLRQEYEDSSIPFEPASVRIQRLEETAVILKGLFDEGPFSECAITDRPEQHLSDYVERVAAVTERMGGARVDLDPDELRRSPLVAVGSLDDVCQK